MEERHGRGVVRGHDVIFEPRRRQSADGAAVDRGGDGEGPRKSAAAVCNADGRRSRRCRRRPRPRLRRSLVARSPPPPPPPPSRYAAPLPFDSVPSAASGTDGTGTASLLSSHRAGYECASGSSDLLSASWRRDVLSERIRAILERCDSVKGFVLCVDAGPSGGMYGGMASSVLEELADECRGAGRACVAIDPSPPPPLVPRGSRLRGGNFSMGSRGEGGSVGSFRSGLNSALSLHGLCSGSDVVLPLSLPRCRDALGGGDGAAGAALALEAATLPYRLLYSASSPGSGGGNGKVGVQSGYFCGSAQSYDDGASSEPYSAAQRLSFREFVSCVKPGSRYTILEMDAMMGGGPIPASGGGGGDRGDGRDHQRSLAGRLSEGTSVERRRLEAESAQRARTGRLGYGGRPRDVEAGGWMEDARTGGLLSPLSHSAVGGGGGGAT